MKNRIGKRWISLVLVLVMMSGPVLPVQAASKPYMEKMPVMWDLKPNKTIIFQTCFVGIGMKNQRVRISDWKIKDAAKKGYKKLSFKLNFTQKWNVSKTEVTKMCDSLLYTDEDSDVGDIGGEVFYTLVDYQTGKSLWFENDFDVTCSMNEWEYYDTTYYYDDYGNWVYLSNSIMPVTAVYPADYDGLCLGAGGSTTAAVVKANDSFFEGKVPFGETTYQNKNYPMLSHFMRVNHNGVAPSIKLNKSKVMLNTVKDNTIKLKATVTGKSKKVTWESSNTKVATVSSNGKVTAKKAGTVTITAKANGLSAKCKITVKEGAVNF